MVSSISGGYAEATGATNRTAASLLNTISGTAPTGKVSGTTTTAAVNAIALSEACVPPAPMTQVQQVSGSASTGGNLCPASGASCAVTLTHPTGGGNILIAVFALQGAGSSVTAVSDSTGETWVHAPNCYVTSGNSVVDCWYTHVLEGPPQAQLRLRER